MSFNNCIPHYIKEKEQDLPKSQRNTDPVLIKVCSGIWESQMRNPESCRVWLFYSFVVSIQLFKLSMWILKYLISFFLLLTPFGKFCTTKQE